MIFFACLLIRATAWLEMQDDKIRVLVHEGEENFKLPQDNLCTVVYSSSPGSFVGRPDVDVLLTDSLGFISSLQPATRWEQEKKDDLDDPRVHSDGFGRVSVLNGGQIVGHIDKVNEFYVPEDIDGLLAKKTELVSFVISSEEEVNRHPYWPGILEQVKQQFPHHIHKVTEGSINEYKNAFERYKFSVIFDPNPDKVNDAFLHAIGFHTLPAFNGFFKVSTMFANGVASYNETHFHLPTFIGLLTDLTKQQKFIWSYQQMLQDTLVYRYHQPFESRLIHHAKELCKKKKSLAFVGIYSAKKNAFKRQAVRNTWLQVFKAHRVHHKFFLAATDDQDVLKEIEEFDDIVMLNVSEGYRQNSRKGLLFLDWVADNKGDDTAFLIKTDDDIYLRPEPLLHQINHRLPVGYIWGFFDYISPVPRVQNDLFFNAWDDYPFTTFPSYPRGVARIMSLDIVQEISRLGERKQLRMIFGDDPCLGVHMRQTIYGESRFPQITMDDFGSYTRFAMEPTCEKTWSSIKDGSWVVHHIDSNEILCMWRTDIEQGLYDGRWKGEEFPNLCECVNKDSVRESDQL